MRNRITLGELLRAIGDAYPIEKSKVYSIYKAIMQRINGENDKIKLLGDDNER